MARARALPIKASLAHHLRDYANFHPSPASRFVGATATVLVVFTLFAGLSYLTVGAPGGHGIHLGHLLLGGTVVLYAGWDVALACFVAPLIALSFPMAAVVSRGGVFALATIGVALLVGQIGWTRPRPRPRQALVQILVAPLFFAAVLLGLWPMRKTALAL